MKTDQKISVKKSGGKILISIDEKEFGGDFDRIEDLVDCLISESRANEESVDFEKFAAENV